MKLLDYQIDNVRRAVRQYVDENSLVEDELLKEPPEDNVLVWVEGASERQALIDLVERVDEILHPNQWRR
jgi:hypothetical protein